MPQCVYGGQRKILGVGHLFPVLYTTRPAWKLLWFFSLKLPLHHKGAGIRDWATFPASRNLNSDLQASVVSALHTESSPLSALSSVVYMSSNHYLSLLSSLLPPHCLFFLLVLSSFLPSELQYQSFNFFFFLRIQIVLPGGLGMWLMGNETPYLQNVRAEVWSPEPK